MQFIEAISNQNLTFAKVVNAENPGFSFSIKGACLEWRDVLGDGSLWQDKSGTFEVKRKLEPTETGIRIHTSIRNVSTEVAPTLTALEILNVPLEVRPDDWVNYSCKGGVTDWWVPPQAYKTCVSYGLENAFYLQSHGAGRSTNEDMPLMICVAEPLQAGLFFGMEWSGEWVLKMGKDKQGGVIVAAFLNHTLSYRQVKNISSPSSI